MTGTPGPRTLASHPVLPWGAAGMAVYAVLAWMLVREDLAKPPTMLHWTGTGFLILGVLLAAKGISNVRREWTVKPGIAGTVRLALEPKKVAPYARRAGDWLRRLIGRPPRHATVSGDLSVHLPVDASLSAAGTVTWVKPPVDSTVEERLDWLETHMLTTGTRLDDLGTELAQETEARFKAGRDEEKARIAEDQAIRNQLANLAGGGLRLQSWGVVFILAGTVLTAIW